MSTGAFQKAHSIICAMVKVVAILGMGDLPPLSGNPYNGYINPYEIGLMSLSSTIWKYRELIDPIAQIAGV